MYTYAFIQTTHYKERDRHYKFTNRYPFSGDGVEFDLPKEVLGRS